MSKTSQRRRSAQQQRSREIGLPWGVLKQMCAEGGTKLIQESPVEYWRHFSAMVSSRGKRVAPRAVFASAMERRSAAIVEMAKVCARVRMLMPGLAMLDTMDSLSSDMPHELVPALTLTRAHDVDCQWLRTQLSPADQPGLAVGTFCFGTGLPGFPVVCVMMTREGVQATTVVIDGHCFACRDPQQYRLLLDAQTSADMLADECSAMDVLADFADEQAFVLSGQPTGSQTRAFRDAATTAIELAQAPLAIMAICMQDSMRERRAELRTLQERASALEQEAARLRRDAQQVERLQARLDAMVKDNKCLSAQLMEVRAQSDRARPAPSLPRPALPNAHVQTQGQAGLRTRLAALFWGPFDFSAKSDGSRPPAERALARGSLCALTQVLVRQ